MKRGLRLWIVAFGCLLLVPAVLYWAQVWISHPVQPKDARVAFERLAGTPLKRVGNEVSADLSLKTPSDSAWSRIRRNWGDPGYVIVAASPGAQKRLYCLKDLGLRVAATANGGALTLDVAEYPPYGYSVDCLPAGLIFRAPPGTAVRIHARMQHSIGAEADLAVEPYWTAGTKDRLVGIALREDLRLLVTVLAVAGVVTISFAAMLHHLGRLRSTS